MVKMGALLQDELTVWGESKYMKSPVVESEAMLHAGQGLPGTRSPWKGPFESLPRCLGLGIKGISLVNRNILFAAMMVAACSLFAADTNRYEGGKWALADTGQVLAAAKEITVAKYPDSDDAIVEKRMVRVYRADGTGESQDESFVKVLTEKGKRNNRTLWLSYMLPYFTVEVVKLEVFKPDGEVIPVDVAANSKDSIDDSQMAMNIYDPNSRVLAGQHPQAGNRRYGPFRDAPDGRAGDYGRGIRRGECV